MSGFYNALGSTNRISALVTAMQEAYWQLSTGSNSPTAADDPAGSVIADSLEISQNSTLVEIENNEQELSRLQMAESTASTVQSNLGEIQQLQLMALGYAGDPYAVEAVQAQIDDLLASIETAIAVQPAGTQPGFEAGEELQALLDNGVSATGDPDAVLEATAEVGLQRVQNGARASEVQATIRAQTTQAANLSASLSQVIDTNYAIALVKQVSLNLRSLATSKALTALFDLERHQVALLTGNNS